MRILYITYENVYRTAILQAMVIKPLSLLSSKFNIKFTITSIYKDEELDSIYHKNKDNNTKKYPDLEVIEFKKSLKENQALGNFINDLIPMLRYTIKASKKHDIMHCRAYGGALIGLITHIFTKTPYIFDMRGTLPEETVDLGKIKKGSLKYRTLKFFEKIMIKKAAYILTVSNKFKDYISEEYRISNVININNPTDFSEYSIKKDFNKPITFIYSGSMQIWHYPKLTIDYYKHIYENTTHSIYLIFCTNDPIKAKKYFDKSGLPQSAYEINSVPFEEMPHYYKRAHIAFCFIKNSFSKSICFPVKFSEYIASELFVLTNKDIGDLEDIVNHYNCGIALDSLSQTKTNVTKIKKHVNIIKQNESTGYSRNDLKFLDWKADSINQINRVYTVIK